MEPIYIPQLTRAPQQTEVLEFRQSLQGLETLMPVQGQLQVTHHGNYLEVSAIAETILTLSCHRCLQNYNYRLKITPSELIWLQENPESPDFPPLDRDLTSEDLVETLSPTGWFDGETWLYEQLCLAIPQRQLCDRQCPGIQPVAEPEAISTVDRRWASLASLKQQLSEPT